MLQENDSRLLTNSQESQEASQPETILQGALVLVRFVGGSRRRSGRPPKRSPIREFSQRSRRRLLKFLHRIRWRTSLFLTLTIREIVSPAVAKRHLHRWLRWFRYHYPHWGVIWKMEFQVRGAPHFHLLLIPPAGASVPYIDLGEIYEAWGLGYCWIERVTPDRMSYYLSKYVAKPLDGSDFDDDDLAGWDPEGQAGKGEQGAALAGGEGGQGEGPAGGRGGQGGQGEGGQGEGGQGGRPSLDLRAISGQWLGRFWGRIGRIDMANVVVNPGWIWMVGIFLDRLERIKRWAKENGIVLRGWVTVLLPVQLS